MFEEYFFSLHENFDCGKISEWKQLMNISKQIN
jgi:hypothetical protein